jgi:hypothetical protein
MKRLLWLETSNATPVTGKSSRVALVGNESSHLTLSGHKTCNLAPVGVKSPKI